MVSTDRLPGALRRLAEIGVAPDDPDDLRLDKAMLTLVTSLIAVMSFAWIGIYLAIDLPGSAAIPFVYQVVVVGGLVAFARSKRIEGIRALLLVLMMVLPFALQCSLGGFANGSAVAAWAGITPILAYLFGGWSRASLAAFLVLLVVSATLESTLADSAPHIDASVRAGLFAMNLAGPSVAAFPALLYFTTQRTVVRAALVREHQLLEAEQERSEQLLLNILPAPIAAQLRGGATTRRAGPMSPSCSRTSSASPLWPRRWMRRRSSTCSTRSSSPSTSSWRPQVSRRSRPSATRTWSRAACRRPAPVTSSICSGWRWRWVRRRHASHR